MGFFDKIVDSLSDVARTIGSTVSNVANKAVGVAKDLVSKISGTPQIVPPITIPSIFSPSISLPISPVFSSSPSIKTYNPPPANIPNVYVPRTSIVASPEPSMIGDLINIIGKNPSFYEPIIDRNFSRSLINEGILGGISGVGKTIGDIGNTA